VAVVKMSRGAILSINMNRLRSGCVMVRPAALLLYAVIGVIFFLATSNSAQDLPKKVVRSESDLPRFSYPLSETAQAVLSSNDVTFNNLANQVRPDLASIFRDYDIQDKGVLINLLSHKVDIETLAGDDAEALKTCEQMRLLFEQPELKVMGMFSDVSFLESRMATGNSSGSVFQSAYEKNFRARVEALPWDVVAERIRNRKAKFDKLTVEYVKARVEAEIEPFVSKNRALDFPMATRLIYWRGELLTEVPQREIVLQILSTYISQHTALAVPSPINQKP